MENRLWAFFSFLALCVFFGMGPVENLAANGAASGSAGSSREIAGKPLVALSIPPQEYFARRIAGDRIETMVLAGSGQNPHNYEPNPRQMRELADAGAWVLSGTEFEIGLAPKIRKLFPSLPIIDGTEGIRFRDSEAHDDHHDHKDSVDRHTWLSPEAALVMASHIRDALSAMDRGNASFYRENYEALARDIQEEFAKLRIELAPLRGSTVLVYHPAFGYFLDEFGITQKAVETGGKEPTPRILTQIIDEARLEGIRVIFVQAQFPAESSQTVASAVGAEVTVLDPLAWDWLANIRGMGEALKRAAALRHE